MKVIRMYIYEALCLITASVVMGSIVGILVATTLTLQFNLFTELPFVFDFPYALFFSVIAMSLVVAVLGSFIPSQALRQKPVAIALKNM
jgi:ABC-type antimicrobial peptide transport system permease subunit